jgi:hypothetical protein
VANNAAAISVNRMVTARAERRWLSSPDN